MILSYEDEIIFSIVLEATTIERPDGDTCLPFKRLSSKYEPKTVTSMELLKKEFSKCDMEMNQDPD